MDSKLDLPMTLRDFQFCCFDRVTNVPPSDSGVDQMLFSFYLKHMKTQYETWILKKITVVKVSDPIETNIFLNA